MWYKLLKDHDGKKAGTMVKLAEAVGGALVAAGVCELVNDYDPANEERQSMIDGIAKSLQGLVKESANSAEVGLRRNQQVASVQMDAPVEKIIPLPAPAPATQP